MEQKQQQLTFEKGITNVPSDAVCSDNALAESVGMIYDNGEHRVIQKPKRFINAAQGSRKILYIHKVDKTDYYIFFESETTNNVTTYNLAWGLVGSNAIQKKGNLLSGVDETYSPSVTSIGKTLIVSDGNGLHYFLMKYYDTQPVGWAYKPLGEIPMPKADFRLESFEANDEPKQIVNGISVITGSTVYATDFYIYNEPKDAVKNSQSFEGTFKTSGWENGPRDPENEDNEWPDRLQEKYNNLVLGCYAKNKKTAAEKKCFCNPFFVRVALELYDGSYTHITNPVLMMAAVENNSFARLSYGWNFTLYTYVRQLMVKQLSDYTDWDDIVKDVVVFISDEIDVNDTTMDVNVFKTTGEFSCKSLYWEDSGGSSFREVTQTDVAPNSSSYIYEGESVSNRTDGKLPYHYAPLVARSEDDVIESLKSTSVFYKLCKIGKRSIDSFISTREKIEQHVLDNLTTQDQLPYDDYFSGCPIKAGTMYAYNNRLNIANVHRGFFEGFDTFMPLDADQGTSWFDATTWYFKVTIETDSGTKVVWHTVENTTQRMGRYFYYPDPRAKSVVIYNSTINSAEGRYWKYEYNLEEHPGLHGAYHIGRIYEDAPSVFKVATIEEPGALPTPEYLPTYILTSQVNNPFIFLAEGYNSVGTGRIIGISSITQALSEGQFGQYPLLVFATDGIWAMSVNSTGLYSSVHPMSREVALEDNPCLTQTDGAVFFVSKKGLMVVVGSQVSCVSEQLSGRTRPFYTDNDVDTEDQTIPLGNFNDYIREAFIAYDYRDSLLWIMNKDYNACWIYAIKSGTYGKYSFGAREAVVDGNTIEVPIKPVCAVNRYPDYLIQTDNQYEALSLTERDDINADTGKYSARVISRSMKLGNALSLKSIMQIRHIKDFTTYGEGQVIKTGNISLRLFASNNLTQWVELTSLRGVPWKYYRFRYDFEGLKATDRFAGTVIITQERRTDKLR